MRGEFIAGAAVVLAASLGAVFAMIGATKTESVTIADYQRLAVKVDSLANELHWEAFHRRKIEARHRLFVEIYGLFPGDDVDKYTLYYERLEELNGGGRPPKRDSIR